MLRIGRLPSRLEDLPHRLDGVRLRHGLVLAVKLDAGVSASGGDETPVDGVPSGSLDQRAECCRPKDGGYPVLVLDGFCEGSDRTRGRTHRIGVRPVCNLKHVQRATDDVVASVAVDERISTLVIAERLVKPVRRRVQNHDLVGCISQAKAAREAQLKRHVEADGGTGPAQVVDGNATGLEKLVDSSEPALAGFADLENASGLETQTDEARYERHE